MKRYRGKEKASTGTYLNLSSGEFVQLDGDGILPGENEDTYYRVPALLAVILGPFAGLAFVIFLPMIGIIGAVGFAGYQVWRGLLKVTGRAVTKTDMELQPSQAHSSRQGDTPEVAEKKETGPKN